MILNIFFLEESDSIALFFFLNGYIEEIIENIVDARVGLPVTIDDWFEWLRDEVVGMTTEEEEVIRSNFECIRFLFIFFYFWFFNNFLSFFFSPLTFFLFFDFCF